MTKVFINEHKRLRLTSNPYVHLNLKSLWTLSFDVYTFKKMFMLPELRDTERK